MNERISELRAAGEAAIAEAPGTAELEDVRVSLVRHRGEYRIGDDFCSVDHLRAWAAAGGRWA